MDDIKETGQAAPVQPVENETQLSPFEQTVFKDFYLSFRYAQGKNDIQRKLFDYLALQYKHSYPGQTPESLGDLESHLSAHLGKLNFPSRGHVEMNFPHEELTKSFKEFLEIFCDRIRTTFEAGPTQPALNGKTEEALVESILDWMIWDDFRWIHEGRPRKTGEDVYESLLKTHAIDGKTTRSQGFDNFFREARPLLLENIHSETPDNQTPRDAKNLVKVWEEKHPGQKFIPQVETSAAAK